MQRHGARDGDGKFVSKEYVSRDNETVERQRDRKSDPVNFRTASKPAAGEHAYDNYGVAEQMRDKGKSGRQ